MSPNEVPAGVDASADADDAQLFAILDAYVESLQSGCDGAVDVELPEELVDRHPELAAMLDCLDTLESARGSWSAGAAGVSDVAGDGTTAVRAENGRPFGQYELLEEIGRGGMGVVYRARHRSLGADVAIKMIRGSQLASADEVRRFYQEARVAASLSHAHIVRVHDVGECEGQHYLAMDLVEGPSLATLVESTGPAEAARAAGIVADVARAVQYLHERGIVHRDLKPSNVLLDSSGKPHLTDFGLIKLLSPDVRQTASGAIIGTPGYMAPEQARGEAGRATPQSDVYSLGALLYELITGRPPFEEGSPLDTLLSVLESEPVLPRQVNPAVPADLEQICLKCLEKRPERRYQTAVEVADDLERFLAGEPVSARTPGLARRLHGWLRREPALVWRLVGMAAGAAIVEANHLLSTVEQPHHRDVMAVLGLWAALSLVLQKLQSREKLGTAAPFAWATVDVASFTALLFLAEGPRDSLLAGYPLLIAASGLWFQVRLVWFMTAACLLACAILQRTGRLSFGLPGHYTGILAAVLLVCGGVVAYQVYRIRTLNRYFERSSGPAGVNAAAPMRSGNKS